MNPAQIPFATLLGMIFGWLYYRTGSMLPGIVGHILNNSLACINMVLYGNATIEEQMSTPLAMWAWATVAIVAGGAAAVWLNRHIGREETGAR
jgi:lipopolysaccharide export LptBFGC system permease protein LptF